MAIYTKDFSADPIANPYVPAGWISQLGPALNSAGLGVSAPPAGGVRLIHDADYGDVISASVVIDNSDTWNGGEEIRIGFYVRSGANAGAGIAARIIPESSYISIRAYNAAGADTGIATAFDLAEISAPTTFALHYNRDTGAVSVTRDGGAPLLSGSNTTYAAEASLAAGFFLYQDGTSGGSSAYIIEFSSEDGATGGGGSDTTPNAFGFTDQTGVALNTPITSNAITVSGIDAAAPISISAGGQYRINGGAWTAVAGTVSNGDTVELQRTSSASNATGVDTPLTIGGVSDVWTITTVAGAGVNRGMRFRLRDTDTGVLHASLTNLSVAVRADSQDETTLYKTSTGATSAGGVLEIDSDAVGNVGDQADVTFRNAARTLMGFRRGVVVDLNTANFSDP